MLTQRQQHTCTRRAVFNFSIGGRETIRQYLIVRAGCIVIIRCIDDSIMSRSSTSTCRSSSRTAAESRAVRVYAISLSLIPIHIASVQPVIVSVWTAPPAPKAPGHRSRGNQGGSKEGVASGNWSDRGLLSTLYMLKPSRLTDDQTPFLGTPLVPLTAQTSSVCVSCINLQTAEGGGNAEEHLKTTAEQQEDLFEEGRLRDLPQHKSWASSL